MKAKSQPIALLEDSIFVRLPLASATTAIVREHVTNAAEVYHLVRAGVGPTDELRAAMARFLSAVERDIKRARARKRKK